MTPLTPRQAEILRYIIHFSRTNGYSPTYREIGLHFDINSTNGVADHLRALRRKGYIDSFGGGSRTLKVVKDSEGCRIKYRLNRIEDELLDADFLEAMRDNMRRGIKGGRKANDWKDRNEEGVKDRQDAILRHLIKYNKTQDPKHLTAIADNAMIVWHHRTKKES